MRAIFMSAGFSEPFNSRIAGAVAAMADGPRTGLACNDFHEQVDQVVGDAARRFPTAMFIVGGWDWRRADGSLFQKRQANLLADPGMTHLANQCASTLGVWKQNGRALADCWIEIGNELDGSYWKNHLGKFFELAMECYERVRLVSKSVPFITGSTQNFNVADVSWKRAGFEVLDELCSFPWPADTWQGLHPYRSECRPNEWPSWRSDDEALGMLRTVLRGRRVAITEMGWPSGERWNDDEIAGFVRDECKKWISFGAECYTHYSVEDGPKPNNHGEGGYGAHTNLADGFIPKPVAGVLTPLGGTT